MKVLMDTCVIVDVLQSRGSFVEDAQTLFLLAANERFEGYITAKSVTDIYYLTHRLTHSDQKTREVLSGLFSFFAVADTTGADCLHALSSAVSDYEDAVMAETAARMKLDCIVTRNEADYQACRLRVLSPRDLIRALEEEM